MSSPSFSSLPPKGKPNGCLRAVGIFLGAIILSIVGCVGYFAMQPKDVGYDDVLTTDNQQTFEAHHKWAESWTEAGNTEAAKKAIAKLGSRAYGRTFGSLMDWEKHDEQVAFNKAHPTRTDQPRRVQSRAELAAANAGTLSAIRSCWQPFVSMINEETNDIYAAKAAFHQGDADAGLDDLRLATATATAGEARSLSAGCPDEFAKPLPYAYAYFESAKKLDEAVTNDDDIATKVVEAQKLGDEQNAKMLVMGWVVWNTYHDLGGDPKDLFKDHFPTAPSSAERTADGTPEEAVQTFYNDLSTRHYSDAYALLDSRYRSDTPYDSFVAGYKTTQEVTATVGSWNSATHAVPTELEATDLKNGSLVHSQFSGYWHVKREDGDWRLYDGELHANQATAGGSTSATTPTQDSASSGADAPTNTSDGRFSLMSCGAVSDSKTGLAWLLGPDENMAWDATVAWAESDDACGRKWRLPTIHELATLYDPQLSAGTGYYAQGTHYPAHISSLFSAIGGGSWGWSSEVVDDDTARAYNFNQGVATQYAKNNVTYSTRAFAVAANP